ncbi:MAG: NUDIX domain-containing protein [Candidatus Dojkabacteria bacterium]|nr:NUDIX domain-containing protein [Candidatus Dojkabacteria bacterium]
MQIDHTVQISILRELLFKPHARFSDLNKTELTNDHFNFHIKRLLKLGIILKKENYYQLSPEGLELAGRMDIANMEIIKQPKVGVMIYVTRKHNDNLQVLMGRRLRDPSKGMVGLHTEKVRFGESMNETAKRCLKKETGLDGEFDYAGAVHMLKFKDKFPYIDVILNCYKTTAVNGTLLENTPESENFWVDIYKVKDLKMKFHGLLEDIEAINTGKLFFKERILRSE